MKEAEERAEKAEAGALRRDQELAEALGRMRQYEQVPLLFSEDLGSNCCLQGVYGLSEAVDEIRHLKEQIGFRNKSVTQRWTSLLIFNFENYVSEAL